MPLSSESSTSIAAHRNGQRRESSALLTSDIHVRAEAGGLVGIAIPQIGFSVGLLAGTIRCLAMAGFLLHDAKGFAEYRRRLKQSRRTSNIPEEMSRWGCSHAQIASSLLVGLGFPCDLATSVHHGLEMQELANEPLDSAAYAVRCADVWISALLKSGTPPTIHNGKFFPLKDALTQLLAECARLRRDGSTYCWLDMRSTDLASVAQEAGLGFDSEGEDGAVDEGELE